MKFQFLVLLIALALAQTATTTEDDQSNIQESFTHDHKSNENGLSRYFDYIDSVIKLFNTALNLNKRVPRDGKFTEFKMGFWSGLMKFQPRKSTSCFTDGTQYWKGTSESLYNMIMRKSLSGQDGFNFEDQSYTLIKKCYFPDTLLATVASNLLLDQYEKLNKEGFTYQALWIPATILWMADWFSVTASLMEIAYSSSVLMSRHDAYNLGKILAKGIKLFAQYKSKNLFANTLQNI